MNEEEKRLHRNKLRRASRKANNNAPTKKYEKTKKGFLMRLYRNMQSRVTGVQKLKVHLYLGKELLDRDSFYQWAADSKDFHEMFSRWEVADYDRRLTPTVDRIDSDEGYSTDNMRWLTHSENSRLGAVSRFSNKDNQ